MAYTQFLEEAQRRAREEEKPTNTTTISLGTDVEADDEFDYVRLRGQCKT